MFDQEFYHPVPSTKKGWDLIIEKSKKIAPPEIRPGERHVERKAVYTKDINLVNNDGTNNNLVRYENPGEKSIGSFEKGVHIRCLPPHSLKNPDTGEQDLNGGYGRFGVFAHLGYKIWMIDEYEPDNESRSARQKDHEDVRTDSALSSNGGSTGAVACKSDYVGVLRNKISKYEWNTTDCKLYFKHDIKHVLTNNQIDDYIRDAIRAEKAKGRVQWYTDTQVGHMISERNLKNIFIVNTTNAIKGNMQRFLRTVPAMIKRYIQTKGQTQSYLVHDTKSTNHQDLNDNHKAMNQMMDEFTAEDLIQFATIYNYQKSIDPTHRACKVKHRVAQKHKVDKKLGIIVDYE